MTSRHTTTGVLLLLALLFADSVGCTESNYPSPAPSKSTAKPESYAGQDEKKAESDKRVTKDLPLIVEITKPPVIQVEAHDKAEKGHNYSSSEWWLVYLTGALAVITAALAIFTGQLYRATVALGKDAKATSERQGQEMQESLRIAERNARTAEDGVELARKEFISTHRPKIVLREVRMVFPEGQEFASIGYKFANVGGNPATIVELLIRVSEDFIHGPQMFPPPLIDEQGEKVSIRLKAGEAYSGTIDTDFSQSAIQYRQISSNIWFMGKVIYTDDINTRRETAFCCHFDLDVYRFKTLSGIDIHGYEYEN